MRGLITVTKKYKNAAIFFYTAAIIALIAAAFLDLKIDIFLNNPQNPVAIWFCNTGEMPCRLICPLAGAVIFKTADKVWEKIIGILLNIGGSGYLGYYVGKYFFAENYRMSYDIALGVFFGAAVLVAMNWIYIPEKSKKAIKILAYTGVIVMAVQLITVDVMKNLWGRVRFRDLLKAESYDDFTAWYIINGKNGNKSFPSGHTAGAGMTYLAMLFPFVSEKCKKRANLCFILPMLYTSTVGITRLVMGAHYLSDITMGAIISFTIVLITVKIYDKKIFPETAEIKDKA